MSTFDVAVVHSTAPENVARILTALDELDARYRFRPGPLDVLGTIGHGRAYTDLLPLTDELDAGGVRIRMLSLEAQIAVKEEVGGEKDAAVPPLLRRTWEESRRREQGGALRATKKPTC